MRRTSVKHLTSPVSDHCPILVEMVHEEKVTPEMNTMLCNDFSDEEISDALFSHRWVDWIMSCVTSVNYQVKFNGTPLDSFSPSRGLRQGDPLSPFLFLFVADGLFTLLQSEVNNWNIDPVKIRRAPGVSHLLFADDSLLFFKAQGDQAIKLKKVLDIYATSTGQLINPSECSIWFGDSCPLAQRLEVRNILEVTQESFETKYLGLPTPDGRMSRGRFESLQARLAKCLVEWDDNHKSQAAKEVLIKVVAQAIPVYVMSVFKLPYSLCDELTKMTRRYWWGAEEGKKKTHWIAWDIMMRPKSFGGMGFRDMRLFNQALLAKQAWRLIQYPDTLCAQILKAKYFPNGSLIDTVFTGNGSSTWHAIEYRLKLLKLGVIWRVGNGSQIRTWRDPWIPRDASLFPISEQGRCRFRWVADLLLPDGSWNEQRVRQYFVHEDVKEILKIRTSNRNESDFLAWHPEKSGVFTVKSAYRLGLNLNMQANDIGATSSKPDGERPCWNTVWNSPVPPKVKTLVWKVCRNAIATQINMKKRGFVATELCQICGTEGEDTFHVFMRFPHARQLWSAMSEVWSLPEFKQVKNSGSEWLLQLVNQVPDEQRAPLMLTVWRIWYAHNEMTHDKATSRCSRRFLVSYMESLWMIKQHPDADLAKGKMIINQQQGFGRNSSVPKIQKTVQRWAKPAAG